MQQFSYNLQSIIWRNTKPSWLNIFRQRSNFGSIAIAMLPKFELPKFELTKFEFFGYHRRSSKSFFCLSAEVCIHFYPPFCFPRYGQLFAWGMHSWDFASTIWFQGCRMCRKSLPHDEHNRKRKTSLEGTCSDTLYQAAGKGVFINDVIQVSDTSIFSDKNHFTFIIDYLLGVKSFILWMLQ